MLSSYRMTPKPAAESLTKGPRQWGDSCWIIRGFSTPSMTFSYDNMPPFCLRFIHYPLTHFASPNPILERASSRQGLLCIADLANVRLLRGTRPVCRPVDRHSATVAKNSFIASAPVFGTASQHSFCTVQKVQKQGGDLQEPSSKLESWHLTAGYLHLMHSTVYIVRTV
jgi:hypothetical protein